MGFKKAIIRRETTVVERCSICYQETLSYFTCDFCYKELQNGEFKCNGDYHICDKCFKAKKHIE